MVEQVGALLGVPLRVDDSIMGAHQPPEALEAVRSHLLGMSPPPPRTFTHASKLCQESMGLLMVHLSVTPSQIQCQ